LFLFFSRKEINLFGDKATKQDLYISYNRLKITIKKKTNINQCNCIVDKSAKKVKW